MKTAMQKLITNLETMGITFPQGIEQTFLSIEKEQIIETFDNGIYVGTYAVDKDGEEYYNQTYNQNES
jgi:N-acetylglutamate synthase-like GNAT family acetyltransferase